MTLIQLPEIDAEGYLLDPNEWSESVAEEFARQENIVLTGDHWDVIRFVRTYFDEHQVAPDARFVIKHLMQRLGPTSRNKLFELFPYGYVKQTCRIAGMKRPRTWSTG
ncbi:MAG: TusE/DsrC/DsvC family sulfur relay protein [Betaproteobacteria bacterium]|nr:TusE/DsrC/DsvC family sulfur relay protein [Betaproteobacteria bacterium]